jgi:HEAT repeat protein
MCHHQDRGISERARECLEDLDEKRALCVSAMKLLVLQGRREALPAFWDATDQVFLGRAVQEYGIEPLLGVDELPLLSKAMKDPRPRVRQTALSLLFKYREQPKQIVPLALGMLKSDTNVLVRREAVMVLQYHSKEPGVVPALIDALKDVEVEPVEVYISTTPRTDHFTVAALAARHLGTRQVKEAVPALMAVAQTPNKDVQPGALEGLKFLSRKDPNPVLPFFPACEKIFVNTGLPGKTRVAAAYSLAAMGPKSLPLLIKALGDSDPQMRYQVLGAMQEELGPEASPAIPQVVQIMDNALEHDHVRGAAMHTLGSMGSSAREVLPLLRRGFGTNRSLNHTAEITIKRITKDDKRR